MSLAVFLLVPLLPANKIHICDEEASSPTANPSNTAWNDKANTVKKSRSAILRPFVTCKLFSW